MSIKESEYLAKIEEVRKESHDMHVRLEKILEENNQLREKLKEVETKLPANRRWNSSSEALTWLNTDHSRNKQGLGSVRTHVSRPVSKKYVGLQGDVICFHCGKTGHFRSACPIRTVAIERNFSYVKKNGKDEIFHEKKKGPKWIWVPKTNT